MINLHITRMPGDDEDNDFSSGSGSGEDVEAFTTTTSTAVHVFTTTKSIAPHGEGNGSSFNNNINNNNNNNSNNNVDDDTNRNDDTPTLTYIAAILAVVLLLIVIVVVIVCVMKRRRKAALEQRSARWDLVTEIKVGANSTPGAGSNDPIAPIYNDVGQSKEATTAAPTDPPPAVPNPVYEMSPPQDIDPKSPTPLLCYDSLRHSPHDAEPNPYQTTPAAAKQPNEYDVIMV